MASGTKASLSVRAADRRAVERALAELAKGGVKPQGALVFLSGAVGREAPQVGEVVKKLWPGVPAVVVPAGGVLSDEGDAEGESAAAIVLVRGGSTTAFALRGGVGELVQGLAERVGETRAGVGLFVTPDAMPPGSLEDRAERFPRARLFGGGTPQGLRPVTVSAEGAVEEGDAVALVVGGLSGGLAVTPGGRLVGTGLHLVTEASGCLVSELDGHPALELLSRLAGNLEGRPLVMVLRGGSGDDPLRTGRLRPIRGVNPDRQAIVLSEPIRPGEALGFVAVEPHAARSALEGASADLARASRGAMPSFGVLVSCAGRGAQFYGASGTEPRVLRQRFPGVPFAGMLSSFELATHEGRLVHHYYTAVLALFSRPS